MTAVDRLAMATRERTELAEFLATLTPQEWEKPSLCEGWRIRDVVAHMISYDELGVAGVLRRFARGRFKPGAVNEVGVAEYAYEPDRLLALLNDHLTPRGLTALGGARIGLTDGLIHHQDIRRALGRPRQVPTDRLAAVLPLAVGAPPLRAKQRLRGLRLVADDVDFSTGDGDEVRGPAEPLLMAIAGRRGVMDELDGPGRPTLAARIG
ncbi:MULTISPECIES: maleylpyruvate isomerase family mycothiol-dependent enzyme [Prauserella salsuginis group]|uniref:Maleylpyruvate isomerase family mycothiol-dependent enzyme n=1 Tax=Prauserella salsuginis TaxID=387889 RepID=A0ABW6GAX6_9PSEU|nr:MULTISPECIES: maleylpyruvate isomerase family mycothiol-dependent enzyme [Prauserella salsuginis group]MCR3722383.1 TIGR03083 family protein [Prauserella flava]MCR3736825.1 TIGR03083 family protein [Prauserella salsuginis]